MKIRDIAQGQRYPHIVLISARFSGWVIGGWLIDHRYLLPYL